MRFRDTKFLLWAAAGSIPISERFHAQSGISFIQVRPTFPLQNYLFIKLFWIVSFFVLSFCLVDQCKVQADDSKPLTFMATEQEFLDFEADEQREQQRENGSSSVNCQSVPAVVRDQGEMIGNWRKEWDEIAEEMCYYNVITKIRTYKKPSVLPSNDVFFICQIK